MKHTTGVAGSKISEHNYKDLFVQSPAPIAIYEGPELVYTFVNDAYARIFNFRPILGKPLRKAFPELEGQPFFGILEEVFATGTPFHAHEMPALIDLLNNGNPVTRFYNIAYTAFRDERGDIIGVMATGNDVTEQVEARRFAEKGRDNLQSILEALPQMAWTADTDGNATYFNKRWIDYTGKDLNSLPANWIQLVHESDRSAVLQSWNEGLTRGIPVENESRYMNRDGNYRWHLTRAVPLRDEKGQTTMWVGTCTDIHDQKIVSEKLERKIKDSVHQLEQYKLENQAYDLFMQTPVSISIYKGTDMVVELANETALRFVGRTSDVLGKKLADVLPEIKEQGFLDLLREVMYTGKPVHASESPVRLNIDGKDVLSYMNFVYQPFYESDGSISGVLSVAIDVTEQVLSRKKVEESEARFRNVVEQAPSPILILKGEDMVLSVANQPLFDLWNVTRDAIGKKFLDLLPEMKEQGFMDLLLDVYHNGKTHYGYAAPVVFLRDKGDKETIYFNFVYQPYRELDGRITGVLVLATDVTGQVLSNRQLAESEERLRIAIASAEMGTWDFNPKNNSIYCSPRTKEIFGFDIDTDLHLDMVMQVIAEQDRARVTEAITNALHPAGNGSYGISYSLHDARTGEQKFVKASGQAFFENGQPLRFIGTVIDVTHEVTRRENEKKLLTLVENSVDLMSLLGPDGRNTYINKAGLAMLGFDSMKQAVESPVSDLHTPEDTAFIKAHVLPRTIREGRWSGTMNIRNVKTGEVIPVYNNSLRIDDSSSGEAIAIGAIMRDLRPELAAQRAIAESERNFRTLVMQAPVGICILKGSNFVVELANDTYLDIAGIKRADVMGKPQWDMLPEERAKELEGILKKVVETGTSFYGKEYEIRVKRKGKEEIVYADIVYEPLIEQSRRIEKVMVLAIDVTDKVQARKQIEESEKDLQLRVQERTAALEKSNRQLEQFAHVASHDMKEPIRKVKIFTGRIQNEFGKELPVQLQNYLQKVHQATDRLSTMVDGVLNYATINSQDYQLERINLQEIIKSITSDLELVMQQKGAKVFCHSLPVFEGVPFLIYQLFYNLINNSLKFAKSDEPAVITIEGSVKKNDHDLTSENGINQVVIRLHDNGIGFSQEHAEKIFQTFTRLHSKDRYEGTGLGLALCRNIVEQHGGSISAESGEGEGAAFTIVLPEKQKR